MSDGKWETVRKLKPKGGKSSGNNINQLNGFAVQKSPLYDVSNTKSQDVKSNSISSKPGQRSPGRSQPKRKKKPVVEPKFNYQTVEEALASDSITSIDKQATLIKEKFRDQPNIWLKDVAMYLNSSLSCPDESITQSGREFDFPLCKASKNTYGKLMKLFGNELTESIVPLMFEHFIKSMLDCIARDIPSWGYKLCIQVLAYNYPSLCCQDLEKQLDKVQTMQNVPKKCVSMLWAFGQVGAKDHRCGAKVWLQLMLPALYIKNVAAYSMDYIEALLKRTQEKTTLVLSSSVQPEHFMDIARWSFESLANVHTKSSPIKERMKAIYPSFRAIATCNNNNKRQLFSLMLKTPASEGAVLRDELTQLCIECLQTDPHCFSIWRDLYTNNLPRTRLILSYVDSNWKAAVRKMPRTVFADTIRAFRNTNADAAARSDHLTSKPDFHDVRKLCEELNERLEDPRQQPTSHSWSVLFAVVAAIVAICAGFVIYDVNTHGGLWTESQTYKLLEGKGVISAASYVKMRFLRFYDVASSFLHEHVPTYWNGVREVCSPYVTEITAKLSAGSLHVWQVTAPLRTHGGNMLKAIAEKTLDVLDKVLEYIWPAVTWFADKTVQLFEWIAKLIRGEVSWCCVRDAISKHATAAFDATVNISRNVVRIVSQYVAPNNP